MAYLFTKDRFRQSLRLALARAWIHSYPVIIQRLSLIQSSCPTLMEKYISSGEDGLLDLQEKAVGSTRCFGLRKNWLETGDYLGIDIDGPLLLERLQGACRRVYGIDPDIPALYDVEVFPNIRIGSSTR